MNANLKNLFLLATIVMGSMMFGMTSCSDDVERKVMSAEEATKKIDSLSSRVANTTKDLNTANNNLAKGIAEGGVPSKNISKSLADSVDYWDTRVTTLTIELEQEVALLNAYLEEVKSNNIQVEASVISSAQNTVSTSESVKTNAETLTTAVEDYREGKIDEKQLQETAQSVITYNVVFDSQGGSSVNSQYVNNAKSVTKPTDPTWENHTFIAWYSVKTDTLNKQFDFNGAITKDTTLFAFWNPTLVTKITLKVDGVAKSDTSFSRGESVTNPLNLVAVVSPENATNKNVSWSSNNVSVASVDANGQVNVVSTSVVSTAIITATALDGSGKMGTFTVYIPATVTFNSNGGSSVSSQTVRYNECASDPGASVLTGYNFIGWYGKQDTVGMSSWNFSSDKITQDTTLYGFWRNPGTGGNNPHCDREGTQGEGGWF